MPRYELIEGTSCKFWEVKVEDTELTVSFGRIDTHGQTKTKTFASHAAALAEEAKLIKEKTGKGYKETATHSPNPPDPISTTQTSQAKSKPQAATLPAIEAKPEATQASPAQVVAKIVWPSGGFVWTETLREQLPIIRGIHIAEFTLSDEPIHHPPKFEDDSNTCNWQQQVWAALAQTGAVQGSGPWTTAEATEKLKPALLQQTDLAYWREVILQCALQSHYANQGHLYWAIETAIATHSLAFTVNILLEAGEAVPERVYFWYGSNSGQALLRKALAAAPESEHEAALRVAAAYRCRSQLLDCAISYLFPEIGEWAESCVSYGLPPEKSWWLNETVLPVSFACRHYRTQFVYVSHVMPVALLQLYLHGDGAFPFLELLLDRAENKEAAGKFAKFMLTMNIPAIIPAFIARIDNKAVLAELDKLTGQYPEAILKTAIERAFASRDRALEGWAVRLALRLPHCMEPALAACSHPERERFSDLLNTLAGPEEASVEDLPALLREPPWKQAEKLSPLPTLTLEPLEQADELLWPEGMQARWGCFQKPAWKEMQFQKALQKYPNLTAETYYLDELGIKTSAHSKVLEGKLVDPTDIVKKEYYYNHVEILLLLPDAAAIAVWNSLPIGMWATWDMEGALGAMFARHGLSCLPGLVNYASARAEDGLAVALPFRSAKLAPIAAHALKNLKKAKANAILWLKSHPETAITALIPPAFGKDRVPRENAQAALRWLAQNGYLESLHETARRYGDETAQAAEQLLSTDPVQIVPAKMPKLPAFFVPAAFRRPVLHSGAALPLSALEYLGNMLTISTVAEPYIGLETVKAVCTRDSLAEFAWNVFEAWMSAGAPSKEGWAFAALGLLGNDETARRLAPKIREWPGEAAHARAVAGLDLLAAIGTDVALMHLNGIASKVKFKGLQDKGKEKIAQVAEARGFTTEELADRLVPDLGLDENGTAELDFGPRRFFVGFDETLKPFVKDADGARIKDLPKPNKADNEALAGAAVERYKVIKKDAKSIASLQIIRLEQAMCTRRRWSAGSFKLFFLDHPLMRHLARRLVWGVYREGRFTNAFRVAEDLTLANAQDDLFDLPETVDIGVAHVLEMPEDLSRDFGQIFADYEILQPFRQLGRETYTLTDEERQKGSIERFKNKKVATGSVMGLTNRGWERGEAQDAGWVGWFRKRLPGGLEAELNIEPGTIVGDLSYEPEQTIPNILIRRTGTWDNNGLINIAELDPIIVSEIIRDGDLLAVVNK